MTMTLSGYEIKNSLEHRTESQQYDTDATALSRDRDLLYPEILSGAWPVVMRISPIVVNDPKRKGAPDLFSYGALPVKYSLVRESAISGFPPANARRIFLSAPADFLLTSQ